MERSRAGTSVWSSPTGVPAGSHLATGDQRSDPCESPGSPRRRVFGGVTRCHGTNLEQRQESPRQPDCPPAPSGRLPSRRFSQRQTGPMPRNAAVTRNHCACAVTDDRFSVCRDQQSGSAGPARLSARGGRMAGPRWRLHGRPHPDTPSFVHTTRPETTPPSHMPVASTGPRLDSGFSCSAVSPIDSRRRL